MGIITFLETKASELEAFARTEFMLIMLLEAKAAELAQLASTHYIIKMCRKEGRGIDSS
jgi:hypothetical protein